MNVALHIERLVLDGFELSPAERRRLQASVTAELTALIRTSGLREEFETGIAVPSVRAEMIHSAGSADPERLGRQIARSVYSGIGIASPAEPMAPPRTRSK